MRIFLLKLVVRSVAIDVASWLALIVTSAILAVTVTLDIGLVVVGARTSGEAQQAFVAFGCVTLGFCVLVGLLSLMMVIRVCLGLQRRSVGLWQLAGVLPRTVFVVLLGGGASGGSTVLPAGRASGGTGMVSVRASYFFQRAALE